MGEELIIDEAFIKKHKKEIIEAIPKTLLELRLYSPEDWEKLGLEQTTIYNIADLIKFLFILIGSVPQVLCDKNIFKTPIQKVAYLQETFNDAVPIIEDGIHLLPAISKHISVNIMSLYLSSIELIAAHSFPGYGTKLEKELKDLCGKRQHDGVIMNKGDELFLSTRSKYLYAERVCFFMWANWNTDKEWESLTVEDLKEELLYQWQLFNDVSWFRLLMNANNEDFDDLTNEVIAEYAQIKNTKACATLSAMIKAYIQMMKLFKEEDKYIVETDDREHFSGICLPKEKTKEERRIEVAADYLVGHHHISENEKDLFVNIMNNRCPSCKIQFSHGGVNGNKKKGGMNVLYGIIRFIREENFDPNVKDGKRQYIPDYPNDCWHFNFDNEPKNETPEHKWERIKGSGRKYQFLSKLIEDLNSKL